MVHVCVLRRDREGSQRLGLCFMPGLLLLRTAGVCSVRPEALEKEARKNAVNRWTCFPLFLSCDTVSSLSRGDRGAAGVQNKGIRTGLLLKDV